MKKKLGLLLVLISLGFAVESEATDVSNFDIISNKGEERFYNDFSEDVIPKEIIGKSKLGESRSSRSIIGNDDRTLVSNVTDYPFSSIVFISISYNGQSYRGSGVMIGENKVLTGAHVVHDKTKGGFPQSVTVIPARDNNTIPFGISKAKKISITRGFLSDDTLTRMQHDYAVIELEESIGTKTGWLGINSLFDTANPVTLTGYPGEKQYQMYTETGYLDPLSANINNVFSTKMDGTSGNSGSPMYTNKKQVVAIYNYSGGTLNYCTPVVGQNYPSIYRMIQGQTELVDVTGISVSPNNTFLKNGETTQLSATVSPADASNKELIWTSSNESVATVSSTGKVTAHSNGISQITARAANTNISAVATITVKNEPIFDISKAFPIFHDVLGSSISKNYPSFLGVFDGKEGRTVEVTVSPRTDFGIQVSLYDKNLNLIARDNNLEDNLCEIKYSLTTVEKYYILIDSPTGETGYFQANFSGTR